MSADSPRRGQNTRCGIAVPAVVPPQVVSDRSILDSAIGFINDVTLANQPHTDPKDTITWARFETVADISDPRFGEDWELEGNVAPPLLLILGYGLGIQVWAIPANGEAVEVLSWRHGTVSALRVLPTPAVAAENDRADEAVDAYAEKRPLMAMCDNASLSAGGGSGMQSQFCAVNFVSLKTGTQVKTIKFKNNVLDILANRSSIVITFNERIAVFDARTLEDRLAITTCYPSPGINPNPVALGPRWLAYSEHKLIHTKRSGGGCDGEGVASYTATVLNAAKSFGKGLRELGEQVAAGLTGTTGSGSNSKNNSFDSSGTGDIKQPGIVTILDIKHPVKDVSPTSGTPISINGSDPFVAHFIAHSEAVVALEFDNTGMILVTADKRGHDFHVFRIQPHPVGSSLAAIHHLYVLHRGDTSAKVQNITFSLDSRWIAVSTLRGTTHVFPITPYGGPMGVRTHTSLHVVNKLSRFHRSAGLSAEGRSSSPISHSESTTFCQSLIPYHNPTLPPYPRPTVVLPLAQLRQPFVLGSPPGSAGQSKNLSSSGNSQRQRLSSLSDDNGKPLSVCAIFAKSRSWLLDPPMATREAPHRIQRKAVDSLFVMAGHGALIQYDLDTKLASNVAKEKICDETAIELEVEAKAQWNLGRKDGSQEIIPPLSSDNWLIKDRNSCMLTDSTRQFDETDDRTDSWLSQVEIITHAGPHRRLWMGPQFVFKTYNTPSGSNLSHIEAEAIEIGVSATTASAAATARVERSSPLNMPPLSATSRTAVPVLIESGSYSSIEQSPKLMDRFRHDHLDSDFAVAHGDTRLKEDLADAMRESPSVSATLREAGRLFSDATFDAPFYDALAEHVDDDSFDSISIQRTAASVAALASVLPNISSSYETTSSSAAASCALSYEQPKAPNSFTSTTPSSIEKVVNPLGTVTTITSGMSADVSTDILDEVVSQLAAEDTVIHENCDESLFRPVVAIFCDEKSRQLGEEARRKQELCKPPEVMGNKLVVPVIAKERDDELSRKEKQKLIGARQRKLMSKTTEQLSKEEQNKFAEFVQKSKKGISPLEKNLGKDIVEIAEKVKANSNDKVIDKDKSLELVKESKDKLHISDKQSEQKKEMSGKSSKLLESDLDECKSKVAPPISKTEKETLFEKAKQTVGHEKESVKKTTACAENANSQVKTITTAKSLISKKEESETENSDYARQEKVKTVSLNVAHLTDSLIELTEKDKPNEETSDSKPTSIKAMKSEADPHIKLSEPIEIYAQSKTNKKKMKKRNNKSGSSSETEEIVETTSSAWGKAKPIKFPKKSSISSEESYTDLTVSLLKNKRSVEETMYISFSEIMDTDSERSTELLVAEVPVTLSSNESSTASESNSTEQSIKSTKDSVSHNEENVKSLEKQTKDETDKANKTVQGMGKATTRKKTEQVIKSEDDCRTEECKNKILTSNKIEKVEEGQSMGAVKKQTIRAETIEKKNEVSSKSEKAKEKKEEDKIKIDSKTDMEPTREIFKKLKDDAAKIPPPSSPLAEIKKTKKTKIEVTASEIKRDVTITEQPKLTKKESKEGKEEIQSTYVGTQNNKKSTGSNASACNVAKEKQEHVAETLLFIDKFSPEPKDESTGKMVKETLKSTDIVATPPSAWEILSGADMISKNLESKAVYEKNNVLVKSTSKISTNKNTENPAFAEPVLAATPSALPENSNKSNKKSKKSALTTFDDFPMLKPLDSLPPLPALEPLEVLSPTSSKKLHEVKDLLCTEQESLINFESPLQENPALERKIKPQPRGFTEQNLIFALCGSLHYENESSNNNKIELSPTTTLSLTRSSSVLGETTTAEYKSLTENDEQYLSLEQSSQDTTKSSSSQTSSASEEIIIAVEEKKFTKKQKRKKQQLELQKFQQQQHHYQQQPQQQHKGKHLPIADDADDDDEELRPLISMSESQLENYVDSMMVNSSSGNMQCFTTATSLQMEKAGVGTTTTNTTTTSDSEGPMPHTTTSDDNNYCVVAPSMTSNSTMATTLQHKLKTKKLEHKINLIAAIEAATSSSTSSEESGVEGGGGSAGGRSGIGSDPDTAVVTMTASATATGGVVTGSNNANASSSIIQQSMSAQQSGSKKKAKRRKR